MALYYERLAASLTSGEQKYQMVVSDSQWLGAFVEGGYYMKINRFIDSDPELQAVFDDLHPNLVAAYSSYPYRSHDYYGFAQNPEVLIVFYRKDLFCDDGERAAFAAKYGYTLPCTPEQMNDVDWDIVRDFGEFFRRAKGEQLAGQTLDDDFYGIAYQAAKNYDGAICRSTRSPGSTAPASGTRARRQKGRPRAWSTRTPQSRRWGTISLCWSTCRRW